MPVLAIRCPACGHPLVTVDQPTWTTSPGPSLQGTSASPEMPLLLTVDQAASLASVARSTMYRFIRTGRIGVIRVDREVRVPRPELERFANGTEPASAVPKGGPGR